jgi:hypothetical protein
MNVVGLQRYHALRDRGVDREVVDDHLRHAIGFEDGNDVVAGLRRPRDERSGQYTTYHHPSHDHVASTR